MKLFRKPLEGDVYQDSATDIETALQDAQGLNKSLVKLCMGFEKKERNRLLSSRIRFILSETGDVVAHVPLDPTNLTETKRTMNKNYLLWRGWHENPING